MAGGASTNTATSNTPTLTGRANSGRPRSRFASIHAPSRMPKPTATATTSSQIGKSRLGALATSKRKIRMNRGTARVRTSRVGL